MAFRSVITTLLLGTAALGMASCGGGGGSSGSTSPETGPALTIVAIPGTAAKVALFPDGRAYYSSDGFNLGGGGKTVLAHSGDQQVTSIVAVNKGVDALLSDGSVYFSPDGQNLGGGGASMRAYSGAQPIASLTAVAGGIDAVVSGGGPVYFSPDGLNLGGGGSSVRIYAGGGVVEQIVPVGAGVDTLLSGGRAYYSPDNRNIGGGGSTVAAAPGAKSPILKLAAVGGGVLAAFGTGRVYLSADGGNLGGGGSTVVVPAWDASYGNGPFGARDSAQGAEFLGHLWLSGGFALATNSNSCFATCSYFDLWSSTDAQGAAWNSSATFATATEPDPRDVNPTVNNDVEDAQLPSDFYDSYSALTIWNGQLTAIGATVWRSVDGVTWLRNAAPGPLPVRATENTRAAQLAGALFVVQPDSGEVYRSTDADAAAWTDLGAISGFAPRCGAAVFVLQGKVWIEGGGACDYSAVYNDVWSSPDGVTWTQNAAPAAWSARMWPCVATGGDGVMWLLGGYAPTDWNNAGGAVTPRYGANHADLWYSRDGSNWRQIKADSGSGLPDDGVLEPRHAPTCYVTGAGPNVLNLTVIGGTSDSDPDDAVAQVVNSIRMLSLPAATSLP
jgi:hypothetical protein